MATTTVSDAVVFPQSQGTGLSSETAQADALLFSALAQYQGGEYVNQNLLSSLAFRNHDATNDQVGVGPGVCYIVDDSSSTGGNRNASGNPQGESTTSSGYDFALADHAYVVVIPTEVTVDCSDSTLNQVWVNITDVTSDNAVELRTDGGGGTTAQPSDTFVKIGETNPDDASADTRANPGASPTFESVSTDSVQVNNGLVAGEKIGSDSGSTSSLSVSVSPSNWSQIVIHVVSCFVDSSDFLLSTDGSGTYRGHNNDNTTFSRSDGIPLFQANNSITPVGTVILTPDPTRDGFATSLSLFFPQSQGRIDNFAVNGGYTNTDYSQIQLTGLDSTQSQEMQVYGVQ